MSVWELLVSVVVLIQCRCASCYRVYQGAFYLLGYEIVRYLYRNRELLTIMSVEDAMVGIWLLGIDKVRTSTLYIV